MRRLLLALPFLVAACGQPADKPAETGAAPVEPAAPAPAPVPPAASEAPAAEPAPAPAASTAPSTATPAPAPAATPKTAPPAPAATPASTAGDAANGEKLYIRCRACHTVVAGGADMIGPNLHGIIGRKAGSKPGYTYSPALAAAGFTWNASRLDSWLTDPKAVVPGNKMIFPGLKDAKQRADLIAYLETATR